MNRARTRDGHIVIVSHYASVWGGSPTVRHWERGPTDDLPAAFCVLEFPPTDNRALWTYATAGMSAFLCPDPLEIHLFSPAQTDLHVELLTAVAHYHCTGQRLGVGHTVNFGRPWIEKSNCDRGLLSLPYLDGPKLEQFVSPEDGTLVRFLWLIPITEAEVEYKKTSGLEALEQKFEQSGFDYLDPRRPSVV